MPTKLDAPTLVPCTSCGALNWGTERKAPKTCEGCGARSGSGSGSRSGSGSKSGSGRSGTARRSGSGSRSDSRSKSGSETARRSKPCPGCGRPKRLGQSCCEAPSRAQTPVYEARRETLAAQATQERVVPLVLLVVGGLLAVAFGVKDMGFLGSLLVHGLAIGLYVGAGLLAGYLLGGLLFGWDLGHFGEASLKLGAIAAFDLGASALCAAIGIGLLGSIAIWIAGWVLMMRLFKLSFVQCFVFRFVTGLLGFMAFMAAGSALIALAG